MSVAISGRQPIRRSTTESPRPRRAPSSTGSASVTTFDVKGLTPFPRRIPLKRGETVVFSWIVFKSRAHRDRVNAKVMKDKRLAGSMDPKWMPFDVKRMIYDGFTVLVDR